MFTTLRRLPFGWVVLLVVCASCSSAIAQDVVPPTLRVMTFNLRFEGGDPAPHDWDSRLPLVLEQIRLERPHVIGTQEGLFSQVQDLAAELAEFRWVGQGREGGSHGEYMAIFYDTRRLRLLEYDHYWLSDTPEVRGSRTWGNGVVRMTTWARFAERESDEQLVVVNTHFDHQVEEARVRSASLMARRDRRFGKQRVVVTGDFNCRAGSSTAWKILVEDGPYQDTWSSARETAEAIGTFHGWGPPRPDGARIDWILHRGDLEVLSTRVCSHGGQGRWPSDHFPVISELRLLPREK